MRLKKILLKELHESQKRFLKIMCALAKLCHFRPILADGRYKLLKYSDTLLLTGNSNVVIRLSMCNDMFPRRFNHLHAFSLIVSSDDPSFGTITWDDNASVICFFEPCGKKPFEVRHIPGHRSIMTRTWKSDGTGSSPIRGNVALQRIPVSLVVASCVASHQQWADFSFRDTSPSI